MPTYTTPGVYIEELTGPGVIAGVGTSTAAFIGPAESGPFVPTVITSFDDYKRTFGRPSDQWPFYERDGKLYYLGFGVRGFFENGGTRAVIVRLGSASTAEWVLSNGRGDEVLRLRAKAEGTLANAYRVAVSSFVSTPTVPPRLVATTAKAFAPSTATDSDAKKLALLPSGTKGFLAGDLVELVDAADQVVGRAQVLGVAEKGGNLVLSLDAEVAVTAAKVRIAYIDPAQQRVRLESASRAIQAGSIVRLDLTPALYSIVERTDANGFLYLRRPFEDEDGHALAQAVDGGATDVTTLDFQIVVTDAAGHELEKVTGLSLDPFHSGDVLAKTFDVLRVQAPQNPPPKAPVASLNPIFASAGPTNVGVDYNPAGLGESDYVTALTALADVDDVNLVCAPDGANFVGIQQALRDHCLAMKDRMAVLDVPLGYEPANAPSALGHRAAVEASGGFAALYYPWLQVPKPFEPGQPHPLRPPPLLVPPSGHVAGVMARMDQERGVHYAPANTDVRGVMGLERLLSDREQGLINTKGVNALRIFPGEGRVLIWGARTTAPEGESDWLYVNVRRLMLYVEESIEEGIRWAVFKPNDRPLWEGLKRTIGEFLARVWRDGGLAGKTRDEAFQVRIDEGLNPPSETALGRLLIEIRVAPVRPAEFIIVRIGLWDGGAQVVES